MTEDHVPADVAHVEGEPRRVLVFSTEIGREVLVEAGAKAIWREWSVESSVLGSKMLHFEADCLHFFARAEVPKKIVKTEKSLVLRSLNWLRGWDLNPRPSGYEPDELPGCSTPRFSRKLNWLGFGNAQLDL